MFYDTLKLGPSWHPQHRTQSWYVLFIQGACVVQHGGDVCACYLLAHVGCVSSHCGVGWTVHILLLYWDKTGFLYHFERCQGAYIFLAATKQLYEWYFLSVCPSVCLSVTPFWLCFHHRVIMKFSGIITTHQGNVHAKGHGQRSKVKVTEVTTQLSHFRTVTPVWIQIWWWNDAYSLMLLRRGALLFFKVICQISRSHGSKNCRVWPRLGVSGL